jgi:hypothetical protein
MEIQAAFATELGEGDDSAAALVRRGMNQQLPGRTGE